MPEKVYGLFWGERTGPEAKAGDFQVASFSVEKLKEAADKEALKPLALFDEVERITEITEWQEMGHVRLWLQRRVTIYENRKVVSQWYDNILELKVV